ncbi:hypothetical protein [Plantactinospora sonchi]|uniref:ABC transporter permease n=1 Tax=Plantactinospora sonchi TaxID=1544735 RepID=A0ABU7RLM5_9ACTN
MIKIWTVAELALREMLRRRGVLLIMLLLPLAFYLSRRGDYLGQSIRFVCLGIGWALSTAALFAGSAARGIEPRLRLSGYQPHHLHLGRLLALWLVGIGLSAPYFLLIRFDQHDVRYDAIALIMVLTVVTAAPFGLVLSAVLPRELEGTLVLLIVVGLQMVMDPADSAARLLPFWFSREIGTYAIDHTDGGYLTRGLTHGVLTAVALTALVALAATIRLRRRAHLRFVSAR